MDLTTSLPDEQEPLMSEDNSPPGSPGGTAYQLRSSSPTRSAFANVATIPPPSPEPAPRRRQLGQHSAERQFLEGAQQFITGGSGREAKKAESVTQLFARAVFSVPLYPVRYIHRLVQLGYEPMLPQRRFSFVFQRYMYYYPGVVGYARSIAERDGWKALYRGVGTLFASDMAGFLAHSTIHPVIQSAVNKIPMPFYRSEQGDVPDTDPAYKESLPYILTKASRMFIGSVLTNCTVQLVVHPFQVVSMRTIAQYIGQESIYNSLLGSIREIYNTQGIRGFYTGIIPALLGHLCTCVIHSSLWLMFEIIVANINHDVGKIVLKTFVAAPLLAYIPGSYSYPLFLMSNVMAVNNCGLAAGLPPRAPHFISWRDCYTHLKSTGELYRGSVILFPRFAYKDPPPELIHI